MKSIINLFSKTPLLPGVFIFCIALFACDDGELNTVHTEQGLVDYMESNQSLRLFLHSIDNYRQPLYLCIYDSSGNTLNTTPIGKDQSSRGIPYGEVTAAQIPEKAEGDEYQVVAYTVDGRSNCPSRVPSPSPDEYPVLTVAALWGPSMVYNIGGYLSSTLGGEQWDGCGDACDEPCENYAKITTGATDLQPEEPLEGRTTFRLGFLEWQSSQKPMTLCWDPDNVGGESSVLLTSIPTPHVAPYSDWIDAPSITTGILHLHLGRVDCGVANPTDAAANLPLPADASFGPPGSTIALDADTGTTLLLMGTTLEGVPGEAELRLIPIVHF